MGGLHSPYWGLGPEQRTNNPTKRAMSFLVNFIKTGRRSQTLDISTKNPKFDAITSITTYFKTVVNCLQTCIEWTEAITWINQRESVRENDWTNLTSCSISMTFGSRCSIAVPRNTPPAKQFNNPISLEYLGKSTIPCNVSCNPFVFNIYLY